MAACLCTSLMFSGCGKDDKDKSDENSSSMTTKDGKFIVTAKVENGDDYNSQIDRVKFSTRMRFDSEARITVEGEYSDGGFTLEFPQTVDESLLESIGEIFFKDFRIPNANISDLDAKITAFGVDNQEIFAYKSDKYSGRFMYDNYNWSTSTTSVTYANFVYASKNVSVKLYAGMGFDISFQKGWNVLYIRLNSDSNETVDIFTPSSTTGYGMKWKYYSDKLPFRKDKIN